MFFILVLKNWEEQLKKPLCMFYVKRWVCGFSPAKWFRPSPFDRVPCSKSCQKPKAFISNVKVSKIIKANRYHGNSKVWANLYVSLWPACISDIRHHFSAGQNFIFHLTFWPLFLRANLICLNTHIFCSFIPHILDIVSFIIFFPAHTNPYKSPTISA